MIRRFDQPAADSPVVAPIASGKFETWEPFKGSKRLHNIYDVIADSQNNVYVGWIMGGALVILAGTLATLQRGHSGDGAISMEPTSEEDPTMPSA